MSNAIYEDENHKLSTKSVHFKLYLTCMELGVSQEQFSEVLDAMFELQVKPQQHIIDQGDDGDNFYIIEKSV